MKTYSPIETRVVMLARATLIRLTCVLVSCLAIGAIACSRDDSDTTRTIVLQTTEVTSPDIAVSPDGSLLVLPFWDSSSACQPLVAARRSSQLDLSIIGTRASRLMAGGSPSFPTEMVAKGMYF